MKQSMTTFRTYSPHALFIIGLVLFIAGSTVFFHTRDVHAATGACPSGTAPLTGYAWAGFGVPSNSPLYASGPGWIGFSGTASNGNPYGVCENTTTGALSGYAWSSNYGWISFTSSDLSVCPSGNSCAPSVNLSTGAVTGWARACSAFQTGCSGSLNPNTSGWDGWISLNGITQSAAGLWSGYAWGSNDIGWINVQGIAQGTPYGVQLNVPISSSCSVSPTVGDSNTSFTWSATTPTGGSGSGYTYSWSGTGGLSGSSQSVSAVYNNVTVQTNETGAVTITDSNGNSSGPITCTANSNGGGSSSTVYPTPTATLTATRGTVVNGQQTTLKWGSTNASSCSGSGFTANATTGTVSVTPQCVTNGSSTCSVPYSVTCSNPGGSATSNTSVTVIQPDVSITANPERVSSVSPGGTSVISWKATDVSSCTVKGSNSTIPLANGSADTNGNFTGSATSTDITQQTIFTIACNTKGSPVTAQAIVNILPVFQQF